MKSFLLLISILLPSVSSAAGVFDQYLGCYQTINLNGKAVETTHPIQTEIGQDYAPYLDADTRSLIPAIKLFIYLGQINGLHHMQLSYLPTERGTTVSDENGKHYSFDSKIRFTTQPEKIFTLHIKIDFKTISDNRIEVTIFNKFDEVENGNTTNFLLEKSICSEE